VVGNWRLVHRLIFNFISNYKPTSNSNSQQPTSTSYNELPHQSKSAQWELNPHIRHGKAAGSRYIMGAIRLSEHPAGIAPATPPWEGGMLLLHHGRIIKWKRWESNPHRPV
jgi:hypothetical protein